MIRAFLLGGRGGGGEELFVRSLDASPPPGVEYTMVLDHHESVAGARSLVAREVAFNRLVHPFLWPLPGLRAYEVSAAVDLVHVHNFATWLRLPDGCPVVYSVGGGSYPHYVQTYLGWSEARVRARYRRARTVYRALGIRSEVATPERIDAIVVFSRFAAGHLERLGVDPARVHVIPPGFSIDAPVAREPDGPFTFLLVGRHPERKGADLAVAAARSLRARGLDVTLWLVGDPSYEGLAGDGVRGWGPTDRARLHADFFGRADAVLVPSRAEGYGFAAVEAMGHGLPVVAAGRDALPEIVGSAGVLVPPGDAGALADAMATLARAPDEARALGACARRRFEEEFTLERSRARLGALYRDVLGGG